MTRARKQTPRVFHPRGLDHTCLSSITELARQASPDLFDVGADVFLSAGQKSNCALSRAARGFRTAVGCIQRAPLVAGSYTDS